MEPITVDITPEWEPTCEWFAEALAQHAFERWAYGPVISFMEQVRYLALTDAAALERIMGRLKSKEERHVAAG